MGKSEEALNKSLIIILFCSTVNISMKYAAQKKKRNKLLNICISLRFFRYVSLIYLMMLKIIKIKRNVSLKRRKQKITLFFCGFSAK